jgi:hypothetical protein
VPGLGRDDGRLRDEGGTGVRSALTVVLSDEAVGGGKRRSSGRKRGGKGEEKRRKGSVSFTPLCRSTVRSKEAEESRRTLPARASPSS